MEQIAPWRRNTKIKIIINSLQNFHTSKSKYLLALHSCSELFGIAAKDIASPENTLKTEVFNFGRSLSNKLFYCIEEILPRRYWKQIIRISVAKGPGGFTTTRIILAIARTIAQQIGCPLDSISSFHLMAPRLYKKLNSKIINQPFWIKDILPRKGFMAGKYKFTKTYKYSNFHEFIEIISPQLINNDKDLNPSINAQENIEEDIISLIEFCQVRYDLKVKSRWEKTLPIYLTSPIDKKHI